MRGVQFVCDHDPARQFDAGVSRSADDVHEAGAAALHTALARACLSASASSADSVVEARQVAAALRRADAASPARSRSRSLLKPDAHCSTCGRTRRRSRRSRSSDASSFVNPASADRMRYCLRSRISSTGSPERVQLPQRSRVCEQQRDELGAALALRAPRSELLAPAARLQPALEARPPRPRSRTPR